MYIRLSKYSILVLCFLMAIACQKNSHSLGKGKKDNFFQPVLPSQTNIYFQNTLKADLEKKQSVFHYDYFYNGAGIGIADLDNDGLQDLFFTGNQVDNRLYRNKGGLRFQDMTESAGINIEKGWANGITFADINNDGLLDIYVCQAGPSGFNRQNRLYINKGNMRFVEQAKKYGLNDPGISTQAAFFDYDKDGDLDCFVMNENPLYGVQPQKFYQYLRDVPNLDYSSSSHLFERRGDQYYDVTKSKGLLKPTFGLGLAISDINSDGWQDIYIANDYYIPDALYINQAGKRFEDEIKERTNQVSYYSMGMDIADINNDGHEDIFTLDMAAKDHIRSKTQMASMNVKAFDYFVNTLDFQYQYMFNALQLNNGNNTFQNIGQTGLAKTDWSWSVLMQDYDNDSDKDVFITNGIRKNGFDNDYRTGIKALVKQYGDDIPMDSLKALYASMPSSRLKNVFFENQGGDFVENSSDFGLNELSFSNGAAYGDLDNDGDLELVINNIDEPALLYKNMSREKGTGNFLRIKPEGILSESFPKIILENNGEIQIQEIRRVRGYYSSVEHMAHFGLGDITTIDTIRIEWPSGKFEERYNIKANQTITFNEKNATDNIPIIIKEKNPHFTQVDDLEFTHSESSYNDFKKETLLPYKQSTLGPFMSKGDLNGDGLDDLFIGGARGQSAAIYFQDVDGFTLHRDKAIEMDKASEDMESLIFDYDNDGDNDLYVVSGSNEYAKTHKAYADRLYINDGKGNFTKNSSDYLLNINRYSGKSVASIDYDNDGDNDLIIGNRMIPGMYPLTEPSFVYENNNGIMVDVTSKVAPGLSEFGAINKLLITDFNNDGLQDFIAVGEWTGIGFFLNEGQVFKDVSRELGTEDLKGWWFNITETDVNNDGLPDYIVGNLGENSKYKTSSEKPLRIYAADFDENGSHDMMLSYKYKGQYVPLRGLECSSGQVPMLTKKFKSYNAFANASIVDLFGEQQIGSSYQRYVNDFKSILLLNTGEKSFQVMPLPSEAQLFPVLSAISHDVDQDGFLDIILAGAIYNTEVETPRMDAGIGLTLISNGEQGYTPISWEDSGLYLSGNVKSMVMLNTDQEKNILVVGINNTKLMAFESNKINKNK